MSLKQASTAALEGPQVSVAIRERRSSRHGRVTQHVHCKTYRTLGVRHLWTTSRADWKTGQRRSHSAVELDLAILAAPTPELGLQAVRADRLTLWERAQRQRQRKQRRRQDQTQIDREDQAGTGLEPVHLLQPDQDQGRQDHDGRGVQHAADGRLADGQGGRLPALAQTLDGLAGDLALPLLLLRQDRVDVDALADLLAAHEEDVEGAGARDGGEGDQAAEDESGVGGDVLETRDEGVEAQGDGARGGHGHAVGFGHGGEGERGGLVGVGAVDGDVEGLVGDLPEEGAGCLTAVRP